MRSLISTSILALGLLGGCTPSMKPAAGNEPAKAHMADSAPVATPPAPAQAPTAATTQTYVGWYMEHGGQPMFQTCGSSDMGNVDNAAELQRRVKASDVVPGNPVYVRFTGRTEGSTIRVAEVQQVGSPTPVRNCALAGVVTP